MGCLFLTLLLRRQNRPRGWGGADSHSQSPPHGCQVLCWTLGASPACRPPVQQRQTHEQLTGSLCEEWAPGLFIERWGRCGKAGEDVTEEVAFEQSCHSVVHPKRLYLWGTGFVSQIRNTAESTGDVVPTLWSLRV